MSELIGCRIGMVFKKDPNQVVTNVIIYAFMGDKMWVHLERTGEDQIIDMQDVIFGPENQYETGPDHDFFVKNSDDVWLHWNPETQKYHEMGNDPTDPDFMEADPEDIPTGTVVH